MAIPPSTTDAVKDWLYSGIQGLSIWTAVEAALNSPPDFGVFYDAVGRDLPNELVEVGARIEQEAHVHALVGSGGAAFLQEAYRMSVDVEVYRGGDDFQGTWKRAKAISDAIDNLVRGDPSAGGNVQLAYPASAKYDSAWADGGQGVVVTIEKEIYFEVVI